LSRLTASWDNYTPIWSPDGNRVAYTHIEADSYSLFWMPVDGSGPAEQLTASEYEMTPNSWSPDGKLLAYTQLHPTTQADIWLLLMESERTARQLLVTPFKELSAMFSPDGRSLAYSSDETGRDEVYVQPYPGPGGKVQVSTEGGMEPIWSRNGLELFYRIGDKIMTVAVETAPDFSAGKPMVLFEGQYARNHDSLYLNYDVSPDGQRFAMYKQDEQPAPTQINVVLNWFEELKRLVPTN
jgi:Tol biopolymer transport system component